MIGIILTGVTLLIFFNLVDIDIFEYKIHLSLLMLALSLIGILDFAAGIILLRR